MNETTVAQIQEALAPVAAKIGEGAEYSWEILVWGQFAEGLAGLVLGTLYLVAYCLVWVWVVKNWDTVYQRDWEPAVFMFGIFGSTAALFVASVVYLSAIAVIAPEYAALKFLISSVTN